MSKLFSLMMTVVIVASCTRAFADTGAILEEVVSPTTVVAVELTPDALKFVGKLPVGEREADSLAALFSLSGGKGLVFTIEVPHSNAQAFVQLHVPKSVSEEDLAGKLEEFSLPPAKTRSSCYSVSPFVSWEADRAARLDGRPDGEHLASLIKGIQTQSEFPVRIAICLPDYVRRTLSETTPSLPGKLAPMKMQMLLDGAKWLSVGFAPESFRLHVVADGKDAASASVFAKSVPELMQGIAGTLLSQDDSLGALRPFLAAIPDQIEVSTQGSQTVIGLSQDAANSGVALLKMAERLVKPVNERRVTESLRNVTLAFHNHESANGSFPPGKVARDENGKALLSWRVHVLPFLGESELYRKFHLDEAWDSEHNIELLSQMPDIYAPGVGQKTAAAPGHATVQRPLAEGTIAGSDKPVRFQHITDGTSNTVLLVVTDPVLGVQWTRPDDYKVNADFPAKGLAQDDAGAFAASFADGSVHRLPSSLGDALNALYSMNGGEVVDY